MWPDVCDTAGLEKWISRGNIKAVDAVRESDKKEPSSKRPLVNIFEKSNKKPRNGKPREDPISRLQAILPQLKKMAKHFTTGRLGLPRDPKESSSSDSLMFIKQIDIKFSDLMNKNASVMREFEPKFPTIQISIQIFFRLKR